MGISESLAKSTSHPRFQKVQYSHNNGNFMIIHYEAIQNSLQIIPWQQKMELNYHIYNPIFHQNLLVIPKKNQHIVKNGFCSTNCNLLIQIESKYETTLFEQIRKRREIGRYYSEQEVWFMANCIISLISKIHESNQNSIFGNIHPSNILIDSFGQVSCIGMYSLPKQKNHYQIFRQHLTFDRSYISPELIGFAKKNKNQDFPSCVNRHKAQSYCVGLTLLSMATLTNLNGLLLTDDQKINAIPSLMSHSSRRHQFHDLINLDIQQSLLGQIFDRYSNLLHKIICSLIQHSPQQRVQLTLIQKNVLQPNRGYIQSMSQQWIKTNQLQQILQNQQQTQEKQDEKHNHSQEKSFYHRLNLSPSEQNKSKHFNSNTKLQVKLIDYQNLPLQNTIQIKKIRQQPQSNKNYQFKAGIQRVNLSSNKSLSVKFTYGDNLSGIKVKNKDNSDSPQLNK